MSFTHNFTHRRVKCLDELLQTMGEIEDKKPKPWCWYVVKMLALTVCIVVSFIVVMVILDYNEVLVLTRRRREQLMRLADPLY